MANRHFTPQELESEEWRDIPGYEGSYQASSLGRVRSVDRYVEYVDGRVYFYQGKILSPASARGYEHVVLSKRTDATVHRLVMLAFAGEPPEGYEVNHRDGDRTNNRVTNLEYVTPSENSLHGIYELGGERVGPKGERAPSAKLTKEKVRQMRIERRRTGISYQKLADKYGVHKKTAMRAIKRKTWKHVD